MKKIQSDIISDVLLWIEENIHLPLRIDDIAIKSGYSHYYIQRLFHECTGITLAKYIRELKLNRAAEALEMTNKPIVEVALFFGYEGQQTFTRIFTRHFHMPPGKWRRQVKSSHLNSLRDSEELSLVTK